jgi:hypothetical protein
LPRLLAPPTPLGARSALSADLGVDGFDDGFERGAVGVEVPELDHHGQRRCKARVSEPIARLDRARVREKVVRRWEKTNPFSAI